MTIHPRLALSVRPVARLVAEGAAHYRREVMLPRLLPVGPQEMAPDTAAVGRRICRMLVRALRQERSRGRAGHWSYDLDRHIGLAQAYRAERARLEVLEAAVVDRRPAPPGQ